MHPVAFPVLDSKPHLAIKLPPHISRFIWRNGDRVDIIEGPDDGIIRLLAENGRVSNKSIAQRLGLSEAMVAARIRTLISNNVIQIVLQQEISSSSRNAVSAMVELYLSNPGSRDEVAEVISRHDAIFSAYETARRPEIILNCRAASFRDLNDIIKDLARTMPHVVRMDTLPILELGKISTMLGAIGLQQPSRPPAREDIGAQLVALLQKDGRQSVAALARQLGLSVTATRARMENLLRQPGTSIGLVCDAAALGYKTWVDIRATVAPRSLEAALERFADHPAVRVIAHLAGQANLSIFLVTRSIEEVDAFIENEIRDLPGLIDFTMMRVPRVFKYDYNYNL